MSTGTDERLLRNILMRAVTSSQHQAGCLQGVTMEARAELSMGLGEALKLIRENGIPELRAIAVAEPATPTIDLVDNLVVRPISSAEGLKVSLAASRQVLNHLMTPLIKVAPYLLDIPSLVRRERLLPDTALDPESTLKKLAHWPTALKSACSSAEPVEVLQAWIEFAREESQLRFLDDSGRDLFADLVVALGIVRQELIQISRLPAHSTAVFPRRCKYCGEKTIDDTHGYCSNHAPKDLQSYFPRDVSSDLGEFSKAVRRAHESLIEASCTGVEEWIAYRNQKNLDFEEARPRTQEFHQSWTEEKAAVDFLCTLASQAEAEQLDVPIGRIRRTLYEYNRRKLDGHRLFLAITAVDRFCGRPSKPTQKDLAERHGVRHQAISKTLPAAERDLRAAVDIASMPWKGTSIPADLDQQRDSLHARALFVALVRWRIPNDSSSDLSDTEIAMAMEKIRDSKV